jgi:hypothetical protein
VSDDELRRLLSSLKVPAASDAARERARYRSALVLGIAEAAPKATPAELFWKLTAGALAIALTCVLAWMVFLRSLTTHEDVATDQKILEQMQALFPRQVDAIVEDNGKIDLSVAQSPEVGTDQPIVVVFQRQGRLIRVLSYSGHKFSLPLDGREHHFEILATSEGGVILEENAEAWLVAGSPKIAGYSVRAQTLEASL